MDRYSMNTKNKSTCLEEFIMILFVNTLHKYVYHDDTFNPKRALTFENYCDTGFMCKETNKYFNEWVNQFNDEWDAEHFRAINALNKHWYSVDKEAVFNDEWCSHVIFTTNDNRKWKS